MDKNLYILYVDQIKLN